MKLHPSTYGCPTECKINGFNLKRARFCDDCDHKKLDDELRQKTESDWKKKLGRYADKYRFDDIYSLLQSVINYEDVPPERLSVKSAYYLSAYLREKNRKDKIDQWKRDQESK